MARSDVALIIGGAQYTDHDSWQVGGTSPQKLILATLAKFDQRILRVPIDLIGAVRSATVTYRNAAKLCAWDLGLPNAETVRTMVGPNGGHGPQRLVSRVAQLIAEGEIQSALIVGAESGASNYARSRSFNSKLTQSQSANSQSEKSKRALSELTREDGTHLPYQHLLTESPVRDCQNGDGLEMQSRIDDPESCGEEQLDWANELESCLGLSRPIEAYALIESAWGAIQFGNEQVHQNYLARLWSQLSKVSESNPHAWRQQHFSPEEIINISNENHCVASPYTTRMCAYDRVDQGAALFVCSKAFAELYFADVKPVYFQTGMEGDDCNWLSERPTLSSSRVLTALGRSIDVERFRYLDLYSCFPSMVSMTAESLGFDPLSRAVSVTGGLSFFGGPWNNYSLHAIATVVEKLRNHSEGEQVSALVTANGGFMTKHSWATYANYFHKTSFVDTPKFGAARTLRSPTLENIPGVKKLVDLDNSLETENSFGSNSQAEFRSAKIEAVTLRAKRTDKPAALVVSVIDERQSRWLQSYQDVAIIDRFSKNMIVPGASASVLVLD